MKKKNTMKNYVHPYHSMNRVARGPTLLQHGEPLEIFERQRAEAVAVREPWEGSETKQRERCPAACLIIDNTRTTGAPI